jgi:hypothetical protein
VELLGLVRNRLGGIAESKNAKITKTATVWGLVVRGLLDGYLVPTYADAMPTEAQRRLIA